MNPQKAHEEESRKIADVMDQISDEWLSVYRNEAGHLVIVCTQNMTEEIYHILLTTMRVIESHHNKLQSESLLFPEEKNHDPREN